MIFWICKKCLSLYDTEIQKCPHCGGTEFEPKKPEKPTNAAPSNADNTLPSSILENENTANERPVPPINQALNDLHRALAFIKKTQEEEFQQRQKAYVHLYPKLRIRYEQALLNYQKQCQTRAKFRSKFRRELFLIALLLFIPWLGLKYHLNQKIDLVTNSQFGIYSVFWGIAAFFILIWRLKCSPNAIQAQKFIPTPTPPVTKPPFPDMNSDFERYFALYPDPPTGKAHFRPAILKKLISILENRMAETIPEAIRFMLEEKRIRREHREKMKELKKLNENAAEAARQARKASRAAAISARAARRKSIRKKW